MVKDIDPIVMRQRLGVDPHLCLLLYNNSPALLRMEWIMIGIACSLSTMSEYPTAAAIVAFVADQTLEIIVLNGLRVADHPHHNQRNHTLVQDLRPRCRVVPEVIERLDPRQINHLLQIGLAVLKEAAAITSPVHL